MDLAISHRSEFLANVTNVALTLSPGAGGESCSLENSSGLMFGVVPTAPAEMGEASGGL